MKVWCFSDVHEERAGAPKLEDLFRQIPIADVCVVAGDIHKGAKSIQRLGAVLAPYIPVVFVPGNHEFWGGRYNDVLDGMRAEADRTPNVHLLAPGTVEVAGIRFVGATLWTDYSALGVHRREEAMTAAKVSIRDHEMIKVAPGEAWLTRDWTPSDARACHVSDIGYIQAALETPFDGPTVLVTHHGVHPKALAERFMTKADELLLPAYFSDLTWLIEKYRPAACIHGHMHDSARFVIGSTDVVANPVGYVAKSGGHENYRFDPQLVIDVGDKSEDPRVSAWREIFPEV